MSGMINKLIRYIWAFPCTCIGIVFLFLAIPEGKIQLHSGSIEAWGPLYRAFRAVPWLRDTVAITLGHVVLGRDEAWIIRSRPHERVHVRQYEVWGILFFRLICSLLSGCCSWGGTLIWKTGLSVLPEQRLRWNLWLTGARTEWFNAVASVIQTYISLT